MNSNNNKVNYIELKASDLTDIKTFYADVFGWSFTDYGPNYTAFKNSGLEGGFEYSADPIVNGALVVLYHEDLAFIRQKIESAGCVINIPTFSFPGGERFHFLDPSGNELAVWRKV
jgi:predicted enzyme related to lactoylglutathione lyase